jgi:hypothetical protein
MHVESLDSQTEIGQEFYCKKAAEFRFWPPAENDVGSNVGYWGVKQTPFAHSEFFGF